MVSGPDAFPNQFLPTVIGGRQFRLVTVAGVEGAPLELAIPAHYDVEPLQEALAHSEPSENIPETAGTLRRTGLALPAAGLPDAFNYMYWHLSRGVGYAVENSDNSEYLVYPEHPEFDMPRRVESMVGIFAEEYLCQARILADGMAGDDAALLEALATMNLPWLLTMLHPTVFEPNTDGAQAMAGMTAHIDYDLPEALRKKGIEPDYYDDYTRVMNILFRLTKHDLAPALVPGNLPNRLKRIIAAPALGHIAIRRIIAWQRSIDLTEAAAPRAGEILPDGRLPDSYHELRADHEIDTAKRISRILSVGGKVAQLIPTADPALKSSSARQYELVG